MFGKNEKTTGGASGASGGALSFIGSDVTITGNIGGNGSLHVDGRIDGDVGCTSITLGSSGQINGNVTADEARIAGSIAGTIAAKALTIDASARITGDLSYDTVSIESGASVEGRVKRLSREDPAPLKLIASE